MMGHSSYTRNLLLAVVVLSFLVYCFQQRFSSFSPRRSSFFLLFIPIPRLLFRLGTILFAFSPTLGSGLLFHPLGFGTIVDTLRETGLKDRIFLGTCFFALVDSGRDGRGTGDPESGSDQRGEKRSASSGSSSSSSCCCCSTGIVVLDRCWYRCCCQGVGDCDGQTTSKKKEERVDVRNHCTAARLFTRSYRASSLVAREGSGGWRVDGSDADDGSSSSLRSFCSRIQHGVPGQLLHSLGSKKVTTVVQVATTKEYRTAIVLSVPSAVGGEVSQLYPPLFTTFDLCKRRRFKYGKHAPNDCWVQLHTSK